MRDTLDVFDKTLVTYRDNKNLENHLVELIDTLNRNLATERETTAQLQAELKYLIKQETFGISSKFVALKAEFDNLKERLKTLKNENDDLNIQLIAATGETKRLLSEKEHELRSHYSLIIKQKDEEIKQKDMEIQTSKLSLQKKEHELYEEMRVTEASSAIELEQVQSNFKKQINESAKKLKDSMETCSVLRVELLSVKEQFSEYKQQSNQKIAELQKRLRECTNFERPVTVTSSSQSNQWHNNSFNDALYVTDNKPSKYQPLEISSNDMPSYDKPINLKKPSVYRGGFRHTSDFSNSRNTKRSLPALVDLKSPTTKKETKSIQKKRKLYNPDDLSYLNIDVSEKV